MSIFGKLTNSKNDRSLNEGEWIWDNGRAAASVLRGEFQIDFTLFGRWIRLVVAKPKKEQSGKVVHQISLEFEWKTGERGVVHCATCDSAHAMIYGDRQGEDCASGSYYDDDYGGYFIRCGYGSRFDMDFFKFDTMPEEKFKIADPICDDCIQKLLDGGHIRHAESDLLGSV